MQTYEYKGCVMAVQADGSGLPEVGYDMPMVGRSGLPEVLLPNMTVTADENHPYVKRLVARAMLVGKSERPPQLIPIPRETMPA